MAVSVQQPRKQHQRSCIGCRTTAEKNALLRIVRTPTGEVVCDPTGRMSGRGAYLCAEPRCFERVRKGHLLDRALKVKLSEGDLERLEEEVRSQSPKTDMV
jgi:predicted RNA-binding protein YlxR (DUF448 family)